MKITADHYPAVRVMSHSPNTMDGPQGSTLEVFRAFLALGLTCFGGPIAHLGYFRDEFVTRRRWLDERTYADLVALCQFLPGPASSQVGVSIGLIRSGYRGGIAAWGGFTLPSAIALVLFAYGADAMDGAVRNGLRHGLMLAAVAIVAHAVRGMARTLCPDRARASIAAVAALIMLAGASSVSQIAAILVGGCAGWLFCRSTSVPSIVAIAVPVSRTVGIIALTLFFLLLIGPPALSDLGLSHGWSVFDAFYRSGALVFGGGHVVLPLLREAFVTPGWVSDATFLEGYGMAQAIPGPLFSFAAYLGAVLSGSPAGLGGAALGLFAIFLPGLLILVGTLPFWNTFRQRSRTEAIMRGLNAAVVGLLGAALYDPVWRTTVQAPGDFGIVLVGFALLTAWRTPPLVIVILSAMGGIGVELSAP